jgi:hypothetical protein
MGHLLGQFDLWEFWCRMDRRFDMGVQEMILDEPIVYRTSIMVRILFGAMLFGPILLMISSKGTDTDTLFCVAFWLVGFSLPFLWTLQYLVVFREGFVYSPTPLWPSAKVRWSEVGEVAWIPDKRSSGAMKILWADGSKVMKVPIELFHDKDIDSFIDHLKNAAPKAKISPFFLDVQRPMIFRKKDHFRK